MEADRDKILALLNDKMVADLIYTIFVYGSERDKYFRQADLEDLFYSENVSGNNTIRTKLKLINGLFITKNDSIEFYAYDGCKINDDKSYSIEWTNRKQSKGKAIIPSFKWFEILCASRLTKSEEEKLLLFYQSFSKERSPINYSNYSGRMKDNYGTFNRTTNILQILKNELDISFIVELLGKLIFGKNLPLIKKDYLIHTNSNSNLSILEIYTMCEKYSLNKSLLKKYNFIFLITLLFDRKQKLSYNDFYQQLASTLTVIYNKDNNVFNFNDINSLIPLLATKTEFVDYKL